MSEKLKTKYLSGFIVSGYRKNSRGENLPSLTAVLAEDERLAYVASKVNSPDFSPTGCIAENKLIKKIIDLDRIRSIHEGDGRMGFVVGGVVSGGNESNKFEFFSVFAVDQEDAVAQCLGENTGFMPAGCLGEAEIKRYLKAIAELRQSNA